MLVIYNVFIQQLLKDQEVGLFPSRTIPVKGTVVRSAQFNLTVVTQMAQNGLYSLLESWLSQRMFQ